MADAVELATAYVSLVPSMKGSQGAIASQLIPAASSAGTAAGRAASGKFTKAARVGAGIGAAAVVAGFAGLYEVGSVFDDVSDTIRVGTGKSGAALEALADSAKNVGRNVPADFKAVGETVSGLNQRLGLTGPTLEKVASQYLEAGRVLGTDIDIGTTSAAFSAFQIKGDAVAGAMDKLFQVSQSTGVGMNELAAAVQKNAPAMQTLGFSFEETAALAGTLDKAGLNSTAMMSAMSKGMVTLAKKGEEPAAAFKRVTGDIGNYVKQGNDAAALDLAAKVFGTKGATQFVGALKNGSVAMDNLVGGAKLSGDTILGVGKETQDFAEKWDLVKNKAMAALEPLATSVFSALGDTLTAIMPGLEAFGGWLADNTWVLGVVATIIGVTLVAAFIAWAASIWVSTIALLANPITWIILAIIALIAALVFLIMNWDAVVKWVSEVWGGFVNWVGEVFAGLGNWLKEIWDGFVSWFQSIMLGFGQFLLGIWNGIVATAQGLWNGLVNGIRGIWEGLVSWFHSVMLGFGQFLLGIWNGIVATAQNLWNNLVGFVQQIPGRILAGLQFLAQLPGIVGGWIAGMVSAAVGKFGELLNFVAGIPGKILGFLGDVGRLLWDAGASIINGLLGGLKDAFGGVADFVGGIGSWIAEHKGPKAYDMALLVPAGGWIMGGLTDSLRSEIPSLRRTMADITDTIAVGGPGGLAVTGTVTGAPSAAAALAGGVPAAGGRVNNITVNNPVPEPAGKSITSALAKVAYLGLDGGD